MFVCYTIDFDNFSKDSFNVTMSCIVIPCFHFFTIFLYISKGVLANTTDLIVVDLKMLSTDDQGMPICMNFWSELLQKVSFIFHSSVYNFHIFVSLNTDIFLFFQ